MRFVGKGFIYLLSGLVCISVLIFTAKVFLSSLTQGKVIDDQIKCQLSVL